ncbi:hypothetical protein EDC96DRAFT_542824 [Choanephora cucurbitarum]|nr:hypothetical protein EDC96DRAFT_542824 [Choanephora cucurbitarum]
MKNTKLSPSFPSELLSSPSPPPQQTRSAESLRRQMQRLRQKKPVGVALARAPRLVPNGIQLSLSHLLFHFRGIFVDSKKILTKFSDKPSLAAFPGAQRFFSSVDVSPQDFEKQIPPQAQTVFAEWQTLPSKRPAFVYACFGYYRFLYVYQNHKGELIVSRNSDGFPCPCCKKYYKTAKTLKGHLLKKQLKCMYIYDSMTDARPQIGSVEISSSLRMHDDRCTTATTTMNTDECRTSTIVKPVSENEDDRALATLSSATTTPIVPYISNVSITSVVPPSTPTSQSTSSPLSMPIQLAEIDTSPPTTDDRLIFH